MKKILILGLAVTTLTSCISDIKDTIVKNNEVGKQDLRYYADKTVNNLEVPPDLTKPTQKNAINLDKFISNDKNLTTFDESEIKLVNRVNTKNINVEVKKFGDRRWLLVKKDANYVWNAAQNFLKDSGFRILKSDKQIGILETNFLQNVEDIPNQNLGLIRSMFKNAFKANYTLPTLDKYRIRLEVGDDNTTEVYLTLKSMREVVTNKGLSDENTIWQEKEADKSVETEMLYRFMVYLGSDNAAAKDKIENAKAQERIRVAVAKDINNMAKLQFQLGREDTWEAVAWALDKLTIDIDDRDKKDASFYVNIANTEERGLMSRIFGDEAIKKNFRIKIRDLGNRVSEVYFIDLSGENSETTQTFSNTLFTKIANQF